MQRRRAHELQALEKWLGEMLKEDGLIAPVEVGTGKRVDLEKRALLMEKCAEPLFEQVALLSPRLSVLLERVFAKQRNVLNEALRAHQKQFSKSTHVTHEMRDFIKFSERQVNRFKNKSDIAITQAANVREDLDSTNIHMKLLQEECFRLQEKANKHSEIVRRVADQAHLQSQFEETGLSENALDDAMANLELERQRKVKSLREMDALISKLELEEMNITSKKGRRQSLPSCDVATMAEHSNGHSQDILISLATARGAISKGHDIHSSPPTGIPKKWRAGWHIPFSLRSEMKTFETNRRIIGRLALLKIILSAYVFNRTDTGKRISLGLRFHRFMTSVYGLQKLTDSHIEEALNSVKLYRNQQRVAIFGFVLGLFPSGFISNFRLSEQDTEFQLQFEQENEDVNGNEPFKNDGIVFETDFLKEDSFACMLLEDVIIRLEAAGELSVEQMHPDTAQILLARSVVSRAILEVLKNWKMSIEAQNFLAEVSSLRDEKIRLATKQTKGGLESKQLVLEVLPSIEVDSRVDFDDLALILMQKWIRFEGEIRKKLWVKFLEHCSMMRLVKGVVISCDGINSGGVKRKREILEGENAKAQGYFTVLRSDDFRIAVNELGANLSRRQSVLLFREGLELAKKRREIRSEAVWLRCVNNKKEDNGRVYFVNQLNNERVWDHRPTFDTEVDEVMSPSANSELDFDTFLFLVVMNRWFA